MLLNQHPCGVRRGPFTAGAPTRVVSCRQRSCHVCPRRRQGVGCALIDHAFSAPHPCGSHSCKGVLLGGRSDLSGRAAVHTRRCATARWAVRVLSALARLPPALSWPLVTRPPPVNLIPCCPLRREKGAQLVGAARDTSADYAGGAREAAKEAAPDELTRR